MALLSPLLEKLVLSGDALVRTQVLGHSGHSVINVSEDKLIIIIEFDYQHFVDVAPIFFDRQDDWINRSVHQLQFRSPKSTNHFIIREPLNTLVGDPLAPPMVPQTNTNGHYKKETFLIHSGIVEVNIVAAMTTVGSVSTPGTAPPELGAQQPPLGYGSGAAAILSIVNYDDLALQYVPLTKKFTPFIPAGTPFHVSQFLIPVSIRTALNSTVNTDVIGARTYPIVNITYVEILRSLSETVFSTS